MKYYLYKQQEGQGCDYTIGCGMVLEELEATTKEEAIEEIIGLEDDWKENIVKDAAKKGYSIEDYINDYIICDSALSYVDDDERSLEECVLLEVADEIDMMPKLTAVFNEIEKFKQEIEQQSSEKEERQQYEKLKKKYG